MNLRRLILSVYLLFILALGVAAGMYFLEARAEYNRLRKVEADNRRLLAEKQARLKQQELILERMRTDPAYVDTVIRRKLGYAKPDEFIFRFEN